MQDAKVGSGGYLHRMGRLCRPLQLFSVLVLLASAPGIWAQTPSPAATGVAARPQEGFTPGWGVGVRFEGSSSGDGTVFNLGAGAGYTFSHHFGVDFGVPFSFVGTPSSIHQKNPQAVSGIGVGNFGGDLKFIFPVQAFNYATTVHLTAPTGD